MTALARRAAEELRGLVHPVELFELILILLAIVIALHWFATRLGLPPSAALMVGGGALAFVPGVPEISLDPELALVLFLPPLLMDSAYMMAFGRFRRHLAGIIGLALGAVLFTTLIVAVVAHWLVPTLPWAACFVLGAIVSPPDAVSARAVLQRVALPRRLRALLEGESLLNDATGLILFRFGVAATLTGAFDAGAAVAGFMLAAIGGAIVGVAVAAAWIAVMRRITDETLVVATAALLGWAAYLAGEAIGVSGVIATVAAGVVFGWYQHVVLSAAVRLQGNSFWRTLVFGLEALVFILIGFSLRGVISRAGGLDAVVTNFAPIMLGTVAAVLLARFAWVYGSEAVLVGLQRAGLRRFSPLGWRGASVLGWAGMRGVVTLAIALSLPEQMPGRDLMLVAAFAVILVTVVVQGSSLGWLIGRLHPEDREPPPAMNLAAAEAAVIRAKAAAVRNEAYSAEGALIHPKLLDEYSKRAAAMERYAGEPKDYLPDIQAHFDVILTAVAAGRAELVRLHRAGLIEDETLHDLERDLDIEEMGAVFHRGQ